MSVCYIIKFSKENTRNLKKIIHGKLSFMYKKNNWTLRKQDKISSNI